MNIGRAHLHGQVENMTNQIIHPPCHFRIVGEQVDLGLDQLFNRIFNEVVKLVDGIEDFRPLGEKELGLQPAVPVYQLIKVRT